VIRIVEFHNGEMVGVFDRELVNPRVPCRSQGLSEPPRVKSKAGKIVERIQNQKWRGAGARVVHR
jgi:hypothetical protein